jgi:hypothetical protein
MAVYCYWDEITGDYVCEDDGSGSSDFFGYDSDINNTGSGSLLDYGWEFADNIWKSPTGESYDLSYLEPDLAEQVGNFIKKAPVQVFNALKGAFTDKNTGKLDWKALMTAGGAFLPLLSGDSAPRPTGYQGGIPELTAVRQQVPQAYDPNRRPGSGGQRYFTDVQYVPRTGDSAADALAAAQTAAGEQATGLAALNQANPLNAAPAPYVPPAPPAQTAQPTPEYNPDYSGENVLETVQGLLNPPKMARGGIVGLQDGGFVVPADVVSHLGNGSSRAGLAHLQKRGAVPIQGRGDGMSDSNRTMINNRQPAAVADGEAYLPPDRVQKMGGPERLYSMMDRIRKDRTGTTQQGRQINPNKYLG